MVDPVVGKLVKQEREKADIRQKELGEKTGFERDYVATVESSGRASTRFLLKCEQALGLEPMALTQWNILTHAIKLCRKEGISLEDYIAALGRAARGFRDLQSGNAVSRSAEELPNSPDNGPDKKEVSNSQTEQNRSIMSTSLNRNLRPSGLFFGFGLCVSGTLPAPCPTFGGDRRSWGRTGA